MYRYSRADLLRILRLTPRQLQAWEKAGLVAAVDGYSFFDLLQNKKVRDLCAKRVRPAVIRQSLEAMQKMCDRNRPPLKLLVAPKQYCTDNAVMVASLAYHMYKAGLFAPLTLEPSANG